MIVFIQFRPKYKKRIWSKGAAGEYKCRKGESELIFFLTPNILGQ